jgi:hypothetical protein
MTIPSAGLPTDTLWVPSGSFRPKRYRPGGIGNWTGHLPFANDLIAEARPGVLVELGTHYGESYFGFCQAVTENNVSCSCYAVDTWVGESHSGVYDESVFQEVSAYNSAHYSSFSYLLRTTFDEAVANFADESIDLLHIDGLHTYEAVSHDFRHWFEKVKPGGIVLLHDTMARHSDFGVWKLWEELSRSDSHFAFTHSWGLGVFRKPGRTLADNPLFEALFNSAPKYKDHIRKFYASAALTLTCEHDCANRPSSTPGRALAQVYPFLDGYSAETSTGQELASEKWERVSIELPNGLGNGPLRFDPAEQPALIDISALALRRPLDGEILWTANRYSDLALLDVGGTLSRLSPVANQEFCRYVSFGADPQLFLPRLDPIHFDQPLVLEVWIRVQTDVGAVLRLLQETDQQATQMKAVQDAAPALERAEEAGSANNGHTPEERDTITARELSLSSERDAAQSERDEATRQRDTALRERDEAIRQRDAALRERDSIAQEHKLLFAEREKWNSERESLSIAHRKLHSDLYVTRTDLATAKADLAAAQAELRNLDECRLKCAELERILQEVVTSYSWRVTAPVRGVMESLRKGSRTR